MSNEGGADELTFLGQLISVLCRYGVTKMSESTAFRAMDFICTGSKVNNRTATGVRISQGWPTRNRLSQ